VARELTQWEREETARREAGFIEQIRAAGVEIHTLTAEERRQFAQAMSPVADKFGFVVGYDLIAKTEELRHAREQPPEAGACATRWSSASTPTSRPVAPNRAAPFTAASRWRWKRSIRLVACSAAPCSCWRATTPPTRAPDAST